MNFDKVSVEIYSIHNDNHHLWSVKRINYHQGKIKTIKEIVVYHNENKRHLHFRELVLLNPYHEANVILMEARLITYITQLKEKL